MRYLIFTMALGFIVVSRVEAGPGRRFRQSPAVTSNAVAAAPAVASAASVAAVAPGSETKGAEVSSAKPASEKAVVLPSVDDALEEVNAARAKRGLTPFVHDPKLNEAAKACAKIRATSFIEAHLANDFAYLPAGATATSAGCGALEPSWGWGTCCTYDNYTHAGAAWVMGADGKRYMHLFVR